MSGCIWLSVAFWSTFCSLRTFYVRWRPNWTEKCKMVNGFDALIAQVPLTPFTRSLIFLPSIVLNELGTMKAKRVCIGIVVFVLVIFIHKKKWCDSQSMSGTQQRAHIHTHIEHKEARIIMIQLFIMCTHCTYGSCIFSLVLTLLILFINWTIKCMQERLRLFTYAYARIQMDGGATVNDKRFDACYDMNHAQQAQAHALAHILWLPFVLNQVTIKELLHTVHSNSSIDVQEIDCVFVVCATPSHAATADNIFCVQNVQCACSSQTNK